MTRYQYAAAAEWATIQPHRSHRGLRAALLPDLVCKLGALLRHRRDYRRLDELPDYLLDDVGLTRADIAAAARRLY